jgi:hypothetical protein
VIEAVAIADQRVGEAGEIDEAIPFGIVAGQARDFQTARKTVGLCRPWAPRPATARPGHGPLGCRRARFCGAAPETDLLGYP